jgi:hypothetical protein
MEEKAAMQGSDSWTSLLKADPTEWLLEKSNPGVRHLALTSLLDRPESDPEVTEAGREAMGEGLIPKILARQRERGNWEKPEDFYMAKYKGTVWQLITLAELGADGRDDRIRKACEFILENSQDAGSGGFSYRTSTRKGGGLPSGVIPCLTGNMVWSLIRLGFLGDPRLQGGIDWIVQFQRFDDGVARAPKGGPYDRYVQCWGKHTCHMGVVKALKALEAVPESRRTPEIERTIAQGAEYLLRHHIHKRSRDLSSISKPSWLQLTFPWMWQTDILEILGILTRLGYRDPRLGEAVDILRSKQNAEGSWRLERTFNGRFQTNVERKGEPSKWVTVHALGALRRFFS